MYTERNKYAEIDGKTVQRIIVFGDIHGDLSALEKGLEYVGDDDLTLFLGDYADRGPYGVEVIERIDACISQQPEKYIALKGNHEDYFDNGDPVFSPWTLLDDVRRTGDTWENFFPKLSYFIDKLFLAAVLPGYALFVHGGISGRITSADDLAFPDREVEMAVLWSDPGMIDGEAPNPRGAGCVFGKDVGREVLNNLGVSRVIRSHEPRKAKEGPALEQEGMVITTSSTNVYGGRPFILVLDTEDLPLTEEEFRDSAVFL